MNQKRIDEETAFLIDLERRAGMPEAQPKRRRRRRYRASESAGMIGAIGRCQARKEGIE